MSVSSNFIMLLHKATRRGIHFDLRFRIPDSKNWVSFAMRDEPTSEEGKRTYIVRTADHSEENALYVGDIPEGEYGAGKLIKKDSGICEIIKFTNAHMIVNFNGKVLKGVYQFINTAVFAKKKDYSRKTYAFFKSKTQNI